jgi:PAS domain S-box-containing protein
LIFPQSYRKTSPRVVLIYRITMQQKLEQSEANLRARFDNASEGFILTDRSGIIKIFSGNAAKYVFFHTGKILVVEQHLSNFIDAEKNGSVNEMIARILNGETIQFDRMHSKDGKDPIWLHFCKTPVRKEGNVVGICITIGDITERKRLEQEILHQKVQEQKKISRAIINAEEKERNYIARELHDNINQILAGTKMYLTMAGKNNKEVETLVSYPVKLIDNCMDEIRILARNHVTPLKDMDIKDQIRSLLDHLVTDGGIQMDFVYTVTHNLSDELNLNIYRIIQEQVSNIGKHAGAQRVSISVQEDGAFIRIIITDDGRGFDMTQKRTGIGLSNMINRIESFNGEIQLESYPGKGCTIQIKIPY